MAKTVSNSSIAVEHDIICKRGDTFNRVFQFFHGSGDTPTPITGTDFKLEAYINKKLKPVIGFYIGDGFEITDVNELTASKTDEEMLLPEGSYRYDLQQTISGIVTTRVKGQFIIEDDSTT